MNGKVVGSQPANLLDFVFWPLLKLFWEKFSRKQSHWWHWRTYRGTIGELLHVAGDNRLNSHDWWHGIFLGTNFTWQQVVVLKAVDPVVYQIGFCGRDICQLCSVQVNGVVALTIGPDDADFFGITADGQPVPLQELYRSTRWRLSKHIPLL